MNRGKTGLIVYFEEPFWVGVFERAETERSWQADHADRDRHKIPTGSAVTAGREKDRTPAGRPGAERVRKTADL